MESDWVAKPGTFVYEPPGDIHTLTVDGDEPKITLFMLEGSVQYIDDKDELTYQDDVFSKYQLYLNYCQEHGVKEQNLVY
ncbi:hypothetical protein HNR44_000565 [Geomicrobium halophilum]|uniref:Cupin n=1 Tax=Geomicrobium halophilum TaxID=549000 RepID=A0A841PN30_9BACL|nr:hypothetical protein [Geomicrobium halophilum]MBB6448616.1 hypothetical protein [Geomicrobium halophilum]